MGGAISGGDVGLGALIGLASGAFWGFLSWLFGWMQAVHAESGLDEGGESMFGRKGR